ncbi:nucleoside triphosphate pyrophosphohydrolase [Micromonospora sp. ATCC 39149]|uniref:Nucleoside triphosphate pyrophosphohydrolase n=1 Tax=Micromonospora carbonacea TaxID=47853 RepID=A0A7D5Y6M7_9ACTN|nr:nucleoside triphosphate pyrophosphohydrolase [Micromonospora sp. ATCC 39149]EEP73389.1 nucleoside triphosphate pyrophosphohydrolase [Micromonospora sp. ATCC 39149]QLJ99392.1 nucleoside triphosphate pyrophosphohydrolase [Micromonospora carbonacea]
MTARIVLLVASPRLPAGLLTAAAWDVVRGNPVLAGAESELTAAVRAAGAEVTVLDGPATPALLDAAAAHGTAVWLAGPAGDEALARELGLRLAREPGLAELELMYGSWDPPGARLLDAVEVMDRLASPGGDPWKRAQTHRSLAGYLIEECYEAYDAIGADDTDALREELGDVLLQVLLHARMAEELPDGERWDVDDVAGGLVDKMVRRNPHVFADDRATTLDEITANWERIKRAEKARDSVLDGIAPSLPALALAAKILDRAGRAGLAVPLPVADPRADPAGRLGAELLARVAAAREADLDPEAALRRAALAYADAVRAAERT